MKRTQDPNGMMREMIALSVMALTLGLVVVINLSRMFYVATPEPSTVDYGYFEGSDPDVDPTVTFQDRPAYPSQDENEQD